MNSSNDVITDNCNINNHIQSFATIPQTHDTYNSHVNNMVTIQNFNSDNTNNDCSMILDTEIYNNNKIKSNGNMSDYDQNSIKNSIYSSNSSGLVNECLNNFSNDHFVSNMSPKAFSDMKENNSMNSKNTPIRSTENRYCVSNRTANSPLGSLNNLKLHINDEKTECQNNQFTQKVQDFFVNNDKFKNNAISDTKSINGSIKRENAMLKEVNNVLALPNELSNSIIQKTNIKTLRTRSSKSLYRRSSFDLKSSGGKYQSNISVSSFNKKDLFKNSEC